MQKLKDLDIKQKRVVIREDLNVPMAQGVITSTARVEAALPTIEYALSQNAAVILLSHLGRPKEGENNPELSLLPVAEKLSAFLKKPVHFVKDYLNGVDVNPGEIVLCENVRFNPGEKANAISLAKQLAALGDIYVMDAFGTAHRAEASTEGAIHYANVACAGPLLVQELDAVNAILLNPKRPLLAIVGGSKVSTKLALLENIADKADQLMVGGGILNTFILAAGFTVGKSLCEPDLVPTAKRILAKMQARGADIALPIDVVVAKEVSQKAHAEIKALDQIGEDDLILDIGPKTQSAWCTHIALAKTIVWNGPVGVFEIPAFAEGTKALAHAIANASAFSVAGGGDTISAIDMFGVSKSISYISTGGGAFLECLEGKILPAVAALEEMRFCI